MRKDSFVSITKEELLSSLDIQDWNLRAFAREIHENIGQLLCLTKIRIASLNPEKEEEAKQIMHQSDLLLTKAIQDLRDLARRLTSTEIMKQGFADSISQELDRMNMAGVCTTDFRVTGKFFRLEEIRELMLFSILSHYLYIAVHEENTKHLKFEVSYRKESINLQMNWQAGSNGAYSGAGIKVPLQVIKRILLVNAQITSLGKETERRINIQVKKMNT